MGEKNNRQSNIEFLRILAIIGVIILHYNNSTIGGGLRYVEEGSINYYILHLLESVSISGVDLFVLISGYFLSESKKKSVWRPMELVSQVIVFNELCYLAYVFMGIEDFSVRRIISELIPSNYFVLLYCALYLLSPFINVVIQGLTRKGVFTLIVLLFFLFSVFPTCSDVLGEIKGEQILGFSTIGMYGNQRGYTIVNFILMYFLGAYLRKAENVTNWKTSILIILYLITEILILLWSVVNPNTAWEYCNPFVIGAAVLVFLLFKRWDLGTRKVLNYLAKGAFTVFLIHHFFIPFLQIEVYVSKNPLVMVGHVLGGALLIYCLCFCIDRLYSYISNPIFIYLSKHFPLGIWSDDYNIVNDNKNDR